MHYYTLSNFSLIWAIVWGKKQLLCIISELVDNQNLSKSTFKKKKFQANKACSFYLWRLQTVLILAVNNKLPLVNNCTVGVSWLM